MALCAGAGTGAIVDLTSRRIPNTVSVATAAVGVVLASIGVSGVTLPSSLLGFAVGLLLMLPGHVLGATGAGDVKLFAAAGAVLGAGRVLQAFFLVAIAGGVLALGVAWWRGRLGRTMAHTARLCGRPLATRPLIEAPAEQNRFPYGPAIAIGSVLAAFL
jgi:prepilin peptidase CpaA